MHVFSQQANDRKIMLTLAYYLATYCQYSAVDNENSYYGIRVSNALL